MDNLPGKYRFQIRNFFIIVLALSVLALLVSSITAIVTKPSGYVAPYDWIGRMFGLGLVAGAISFLLLLNLDKNIGRAMNKDGQTYVHIPGTGRRAITRVIWIVIGVCILLFLYMFAWLSAGFRG